MAGSMLSAGGSTTWGPGARASRAFFRVLTLFGARGAVARLKRRLSWFTHHMTVCKLANMLQAAAEFALKREVVRAWPVFLRIDISPLCNLRCTICVHADPNGNPALEKQEFRRDQRMTVEQFRGIVEEVKCRSSGVSLYYLGDPLMHPDLDELCRIGGEAGLNVHYSTNLSFRLSDERVRRIVTSGLTHLTVCLDGLSQEKYSLTRVGGHVDLVISNLRRICACRKTLRRRDPLVEVQYIKYRHNLDELDEARRVLTELGVDQIHELWGGLHNYTDRDPGRYTVFGPAKNGWVPRCHWPHFFAQIKYNGDVLPCCCFRLGQQYTRIDDPRCVGNVFEGGVRQVWNSMAYRQSRRLASKPQAIRSEPWLGENFCYACPRVFETDYAEATCRWGRDYSFEELYLIGPRGRPVRRREVSGTAVAASRGGGGSS
jgi:MoaA/NifB/PqqE/SkfB family radical SAM enzyme